MLEHDATDNRANGATCGIAGNPNSDGDGALNKVLDDLGVTDTRERERFFVRQDD